MIKFLILFLFIFTLGCQQGKNGRLKLPKSTPGTYPPQEPVTTQTQGGPILCGDCDSGGTRDLVSKYKKRVLSVIDKVDMIYPYQEFISTNTLKEELKTINNPALLIWGNQDIITPPFVGEKFNELLKNSELHFINKCGHAPMMEHPETFNSILKAYLIKLAA